MSRQLWLLRHGDAEPHGTRVDAQRRLTDRGEEQSVAAGKALQALGIDFEMVLTSPKVRARDTAALASRHIGADPVEHDPLASGFDRDEALALTAGVAMDARLLVVGHEPDFSQVVFDLTGATVDFKKGGVAGVRVNEVGPSELIVLLRPRELAAIAGGETGA